MFFSYAIERSVLKNIIFSTVERAPSLGSYAKLGIGSLNDRVLFVGVKLNLVECWHNFGIERKIC